MRNKGPKSSSRISEIVQITLTVLAVFFGGCISENQTENCPAGKPLPIFSADLPGVGSYRFQENDASTTEEFNYRNDAEVAITQSGCEEVVQIFRFTMPVDTIPDESLNSLTGKFRMLSAIDRKYSMYAQYANAMEELLPNRLRRGEAYELQPGFELTPDWLRLGTDREITTVKLVFELPGD